MDKKHNEVYEFLNGHKLGILSTVSSQASPDGAAIYYVVDEAFNFYFLTHITSQKYKNISEQSHAALTVVDDYAQSTVQVNGTVAEVAEGEEYDEAWRKIAHVHPPGQFAWVTPVSKIHDSEARLLKLTPQSLRFSNFSPEKNDGPQIEQII